MVVKLKSWQSKLILLAILLLAFWLRVHRLEDFPAGLHFDEAANAIISNDIAFNGYRPIFISSYTGKESLFFYVAGLVMNRIGGTVFALRLTASFIGLLTLAVTYRLGRQLLGKEHDALIATLLVGANFSHLLFSRLGFRAISQPLLQGLTVLFLIEAMRRLRLKKSAWEWFGAAGLFLGLTAHTYLAARLFPIALAIPLLIFAWLWFKDGRTWIETRPLILHFLLAGLVGVAALFPLLIWFTIHPEAFWVRIEQVGNSSAGISQWEGMLRAASMLFFRGDPYIRFNIPGMAVFTPWPLIFAAMIGLYSTWRERPPLLNEVWLGRLIMIIAPLIMLLPTALATSEITPSNLRAIGIFPLIVLPIASGLGWLVEYVIGTRQKQKTAEPILGSLIILVFAGYILYQPILYFTQWGPSEAAFLETEGDVSAVASYLNTVETDRPILVSTRFLPHPTLAFYADAYDQLPLIPNGQTLVYPAGKPPLIVFPTSSPEPAWITTLPGEREIHLAQNGFQAFSTFMPSGDFPSPQQVADGNFGYAVELLGFDLEEGGMGGTMQLRTYYKVLGNPGFNMVPFVHLEDEFGNRWTQLEQPGYSPAAWQAGDLFVQQFEIPIKESMPPIDTYTVRTGWFDGSSGKEVARFNNEGQFAGAAFLIENVSVAYDGPRIDYATHSNRFLYQQEIAPDLYIQSVEFNPPNTVFQGDRLTFALNWFAEEAQPAAKLVTMLLADGEQIEIEAIDPINNQLPFTEWPTEIRLKDYHQVQIPTNLEPGAWTIKTVYAPNSGEPVEISSVDIDVQPLDLTLDVPSVERSIDALFDSQIKLVGATLDQGSNELELVWQKVGDIKGDYFAFVHLQTAEATCCVWQADRRLVSSADRPTSRWLDGEYVIDTYQIDVELGELPLWVGLYRPENGIRLQVDGTASDQVQLR